MLNYGQYWALKLCRKVKLVPAGIQGRYRPPQRQVLAPHPDRIEILC